MSNLENINRRRFVRQLGAVLGAGASASVLTASGIRTALAYQRKVEPLVTAGKLFSQSQMQLLAAICDVILPKTDTPSGSQLDCHGFVDNQLLACHSKAEQQDAVRILQLVAERSQASQQQNFELLSEQQQQQILLAIETDKNDNRDGFKHLKALIVFGYFTSEVGATQVLNYQAVPGGFKGSIPATPDTKAWGSLSYY